MGAQVEAGGRIVRTIGYVVAVFAIVGIGIGLTGVVVMDTFTGSGTGTGLVSGLFLLMVIGVSLLLGPPLAAAIGLQSGENGPSPIGTFAGSAVGYVVMMTIVVLVISSTLGGSGGDGGSASGLGDWIGQIVLIAIPTGLVGAGVEQLRERLG